MHAVIRRDAFFGPACGAGIRSTMWQQRHMTQSHAAIEWGTIAALLFTGCIGLGLAWIGRGYWLTSRTTRDGIAATARIDRLHYTGPYLGGRFFAAVTFRDADGAEQAAEIPLSAAIWNRLREGRSVGILYSATDPYIATLGGRRMRAFSEAAGAIFFVLGVLLALGAVWLIVSSLAGRFGSAPNPLALLRASTDRDGARRAEHPVARVAQPRDDVAVIV